MCPTYTTIPALTLRSQHALPGFFLPVRPCGGCASSVSVCVRHCRGHRLPRFSTCFSTSTPLPLSLSMHSLSRQRIQIFPQIFLCLDRSSVSGSSAFSLVRIPPLPVCCLPRRSMASRGLTLLPLLFHDVQCVTCRGVAVFFWRPACSQGRFSATTSHTVSGVVPREQGGRYLCC